MKGEKLGRFQQILHKEGTSFSKQQNKENIELAMRWIIQPFTRSGAWWAVEAVRGRELSPRPAVGKSEPIRALGCSCEVTRWVQHL